MLVPSPAGRQHQVTGVHPAGLAVDNRLSSLPFEDKAQGVDRVPVRRRRLAGPQRLQRSVHQTGSRIPTGHVDTRVHKLHDPPLDNRGIGDFGGFEQDGLYDRPSPVSRLLAAGRKDVVGRFPERYHVVLPPFFTQSVWDSI